MISVRVYHVISTKVPEPQFEGQTKTKLGNSEVKSIVEMIVGEQLQQYLEENPSVAKKIIEKCLRAAEAREAARKARELIRRKNALEFSGLPGKLADCSISDPDHCELTWLRVILRVVQQSRAETDASRQYFR